MDGHISNQRAMNSASEAPGPDQMVDQVIDQARDALLAVQQSDGHWIFELEADSTIPSEYIFLKHFLDEVDVEVEEKIANYLRANQAAHGGWPLFADGEFNLSASVKVYYALKIVGDDPDAPHMARARQAILEHGGAECSNVFTRFSLALFGQVPWRAVPLMPIEIMLLPRWFPFHLSKVSYWSRTVIVPSLIIMALKPRARNPRNIGMQELFRVPPDEIAQFNANPTGDRLGDLYLAADQALRKFEPYLPKVSRQLAIQKAVEFITPRLNGEDGLGGIFPAMANAVMAMDALGYGKEHPDLVAAKRSVDKLLMVQGDRGYCQPCLSPIWGHLRAADPSVGGPRSRDLRPAGPRTPGSVRGDRAAPGGLLRERGPLPLRSVPVRPRVSAPRGSRSGAPV